MLQDPSMLLDDDDIPEIDFSTESVLKDVKFYLYTKWVWFWSI